MLDYRTKYFPDLETKLYLNHAAIAPVAKPVRKAIEKVLANYAKSGIDAFMDALPLRETLRTRLANWLGEQPESIAFAANTTSALHLIAQAIDWKKDDLILLFDREFPANILPWKAAAETFDLRVELLPAPAPQDPSFDGESYIEQVIARIEKEKPRVVSLSAVQFQTGIRMPIRPIADAVHTWGGEVVVDAIQAFGATRLSAKDDAFDYLACGSHKWLLGIEGAGFLFASPKARERWSPSAYGWLGTNDPFSFLSEGPGRLSYDQALSTDARATELGTFGNVALVALEASTRMIEEVGIVEVQERVAAFARMLHLMLLDAGIRSCSLPESRSGIISIPPGQIRDVSGFQRALSDAGISAGYPDGCIRFAPHFYHGEDEFEVLRDTLSVCCNR